MPAAENGEVRIHYELCGAANDLVLLLGNSLGSNLHMWDKVLPQLEKTHRILRYDMRGHGASSVPGPPYSLDQLGRDVLMLLDDLGMDRVDFCGLSLGGQVALWLAIHAPQRVRRLVLANTAARIGTAEMWDRRVAAVRGAGMDSLAAVTLERWFTPEYREQHPEEMATFRQMIASTDANGYSACCGVLRDADLRTEISAIGVPSLVITGKHDPATPAADGRALHAGLCDSRYVELDASHLSAWERADEFAAAVHAFLDGGEPSHG